MRDDKAQMMVLEAIFFAITVVIALILVQLIGYYGVLLAVLLSLFSASVLMVYLFHRSTGYSFVAYFRSIPVKLLTISCVLAGSLLIFAQNSTNLNTLGAAGFCLLFYMGSIMVLLTEEEKLLFLKIKSTVFHLARTT